MSPYNINMYNYFFLYVNLLAVKKKNRKEKIKKQEKEIISFQKTHIITDKN